MTLHTQIEERIDKSILQFSTMLGDEPRPIYLLKFKTGVEDPLYGNPYGDVDRDNPILLEGRKTRKPQNEQVTDHGRFVDADFFFLFSSVEVRDRRKVHSFEPSDAVLKITLKDRILFGSDEYRIVLVKETGDIGTTPVLLLLGCKRVENQEG